MADPEAPIVRGGALFLGTLSVVHIVWHAFNNLLSDLRRKRKHR
jgi:hypothetical protein